MENDVQQGEVVGQTEPAVLEPVPVVAQSPSSAAPSQQPEAAPEAAPEEDEKPDLEVAAARLLELVDVRAQAGSHAVDNARNDLRRALGDFYERKAAEEEKAQAAEAEAAPQP